jgi:hypothetical protein
MKFPIAYKHLSSKYKHIPSGTIIDLVYNDDYGLVEVVFPREKDFSGDYIKTTDLIQACLDEPTKWQLIYRNEDISSE